MGPVPTSRVIPRCRAVIFDWGGTLTPWHSVDLEEQWLVFARQVHAQEEHATVLAARILAAEEAAWGRSRTEHSSARLHEILAEAGFDPGDLVREAAWSADYHRGVFERDGVLDLIDADLYSSELAWTKPHPEAFRAAAAALGVAPTEAVYVGDRPFEDIHGSQLAGMRAIWVPHSQIPVDQQVSVDVTPDGVAHQLLEILDIIDGWQSP